MTRSDYGVTTPPPCGEEGRGSPDKTKKGRHTHDLPLFFTVFLAGFVGLCYLCRVKTNNANHINMTKRILLCVALLWMAIGIGAAERKKLNFNAGWRLMVGDVADAANADFDDSAWKQVTLPYAFNGDEAFRKDIVDLTDTVCWYRKEFQTPLLSPEGEEASPREGLEGVKYFIEFEGVRQGADVYLNGQKVGFSDNGVMAFGFDLTPYIKQGRNVLAVRCDNSWTYRDRVLNSRYQWNDKNFNANYGGIPKNVYLHITDKLYQTLPLYSNLGTTGTYVYATDIDVAGHKAVIHVESEVRNEDSRPRTFFLTVVLKDADGKKVVGFNGNERITLQPGETTIAKAEQEVKGLHFWSWGYGYLYTVETYLRNSLDDAGQDQVITRTGFRKTRFGEGKIWLNDRVMMVHGYAQRTSNEWPGVGISVPAWLSDYSNNLMVESGANMVRWMHVTPWKQDIESCDRVGLPQAMPAGDAEKDVEGARWQQRTALMRDAIIYNRNNPSILFYECGNESISREHMLEMKAIRDQYDPHGGRAIGSREMLDIDEAEYGGEMLYINKSKKHPMWAMEYCRDEGLRKYWNEWSYPYHKEGEGPLYRGNPATEYNHNMDQFAVEMVRRWYDYWRERPGTGTRVSSGGVKIVFSDTNTHHRGESNYRTSGVVDAMRIPKDAFFAHQVMWDGWVEPEKARTYIVGHWNGPSGPTPQPLPAREGSGHSANKTPVYVVSTADAVELFLNGRSLGFGEQNYRYLFTFEDVPYEAGTLEAVGSDGSRYKLETVGKPYQLKLTAIENPEGTKADGADMVLFEVEVVDKQGRRCPLDNRMIDFELEGEATWIGGIACRNDQTLQQPADANREGLLDAAATKNVSDNYVGAMSLPVECGVNRVLVRTTTKAGKIRLNAKAIGVKPASISVRTGSPSENHLPSLTLKGRLNRGETPLTPSYKELARGIEIASATAGYDSENALRSYDDNELSEWKNDGRLSTAWITYRLKEKAAVDDICLKLTGWRLRSYPLEVYAGKELIWSGETERSLGYIHLTPSRRVVSDEITIRLKGAGKDEDAFGGIVEVAEPAAGELDLFKAQNGGDTKNELRIVEIEFLTSSVRPYSEWMTRSEMERTPQSWLLDFSQKPKWSYVMGIELEAMLDTYLMYGGEDIWDYCRSYTDTMINELGEIRGYKLDEYNLDNVRTGHFLARMYQRCPEAKNRKALETLMEQLKRQPRTEADGVFWHKAIYSYQVWLDGIFMGLPFYALTASMFMDKAEAEAVFDDAVNQITTTYQRTFDPVTGLNRHAWDETHEMFWADPQTGLSQHCWGRAQGWFTMALIELLDVLPKDYPRRNEVIDLLRKDLEQIVRWQDEQTGVWYQVVDAPQREGNYLEATCSSMFAYVLMKAARLGYVGERFREAGKKAYEGILREFVRTDENPLQTQQAPKQTEQTSRISLTRCCSVAGLGPGLSAKVLAAAPSVKENRRRDGSFDYYLSEPIRDNDAKGIGPFIWASLEWEKSL